ncbi:MAG: methyltransferase domain-containing protein [Caulobacteraceae bacterium]
MEGESGIGALTPFAIPTIREAWLGAIFGPFDEVARAAAAPLVDELHWLRQAKGRFFLWLAKRFSTDLYRDIQVRHLRRHAIGRDPNRLKYLDTPLWAGGKFDHAVRLGLHKSPPLRVLDLGAGPGHFQLVAEYFGHQTLGLDVSFAAASAIGGRHLYDDLCAFFGVRKIDHRVTSGVPLPRFDHRFDLVTAFMVCFSSPSSAAPRWTREDWRYFLADIRDHVLTDTGKVYLNLTPGAFDEASWDFLRGLAEQVIEVSRTLTIDRAALMAL